MNRWHRALIALAAVMSLAACGADPVSPAADGPRLNGFLIGGNEVPPDTAQTTTSTQSSGDTTVAGDTTTTNSRGGFLIGGN